MPNNTLVYWDSMVFIYRIQRHPAWVADLELFTEAAERGEIRIVTSAWTMAEVVKTEAALLSLEQEQMIVAFFENDYVVVRNVDRFVAELARNIVRDHNVPPRDAIHVATAILADVGVMYTNDLEHLLPKNGQIGNPPLRIEEPRWLGQRALGLPMPETEE